jgi:Polyketide cyclase / dehydrase and lipid transport
MAGRCAFLGKVPPFRRTVKSLVFWRFAALLLTALALSMTSAHVLELPQKMRYGPDLYAAVNTTLYKYFAVVGGPYTLGSLVSAAVLAGISRGRPGFAWAAAGASLLLLAFLSWLMVVQPVNSDIAQTLSSSPDAVPLLWLQLRARWEYGHAIGFLLQLAGYLALLASVLLPVRGRVQDRSGRTVHAAASIVVRAAPEQVSALYENFQAWPRLFPAAIRGVRLLDRRGATTILEVDHASAGKVINVMTLISPREIRLEECKPRYDAVFLNRFEPDPEGTRYTVTVEIALKGALRLLAPLVPPIACRKIERFVLRPIKARAEVG